MLAGLILLAVAVMIATAPTPQPWGNWAAFVLALIALLIFALRHGPGVSFW